MEIGQSLVLRTGQAGAKQGGVDEAWHHGIDPDALRGDLERGRAGEADHGVLGSHVGCGTGPGDRPMIEAMLTIAPPDPSMAISSCFRQ